MSAFLSLRDHILAIGQVKVVNVHCQAFTPPHSRIWQGLDYQRQWPWKVLVRGCDDGFQVVLGEGGCYSPTLRRLNKVLLKLDKLGEIVIIERIRLPQAATRGKLVEPDLPGRCAFLKEEHHGFHARALEGTARGNRERYAGCSFRAIACEDSQALSVLDRNVFLITTPARPPALRILIKCWRKRNADSPVRIGKFC